MTVIKNAPSFSISRIFVFISLMFTGATAMAEDVKRSIELSLTLPGSGYAYHVQEVRQVGEELWVLTHVEPKGVGTAAITTAKAKADVKVPATLTKAPVRQLVAGKTWNWGDNTADTVFLEKGKALPANFSKAPLLYQRKADKAADSADSADAADPADSADSADSAEPAEPSLWIFVMPKEQRMDEAAARKLVAAHGGTFNKHLGAIGMFFAKATPAQAAKIEADLRVSYAEKDR